MVATLPQAPPGFRWAYNRLPVPYEQWFDGQTEQFHPHERKLLPEPTAQFLANRSCILEDVLEPGQSVFAVVLEDSPVFDIPYTDPLPTERLDRSHGDYLVAPRKDGLHTHAVQVRIGDPPPPEQQDTGGDSSIVAMLRAELLDLRQQIASLQQTPRHAARPRMRRRLARPRPAEVHAPAEPSATPA